jgi:hypothetical protein
MTPTAAYIFIFILEVVFLAIFNHAEMKAKMGKRSRIFINGLVILGGVLTCFAVHKGDAWLDLHAPWLRHFAI